MINLQIGSFREYLSKVSGGQHKVESVFPQTTQNENVEYITLDGNIANYQGSNEISMVAEIAQKLSAKYPDYDGSVLDQNGDGAIDNMMILASVPSSGQFTPHTTNAGNGYTFAGKPSVIIMFWKRVLLLRLQELFGILLMCRRQHMNMYIHLVYQIIIEQLG